MEPRISQITIADFGCVELSLPVLTVGDGQRPRLTIVSGIHGDETAGLFVVERFLREVPPFSGTIQVLPSAHPLSQALEMRLTPKEHKDLNRIFPGDPEGELPERIANALLEQLVDSDMVVDLHSFALKNPTMAIHMSSSVSAPVR